MKKSNINFAELLYDSNSKTSLQNENCSAHVSIFNSLVSENTKHLIKDWSNDYTFENMDDSLRFNIDSEIYEQYKDFFNLITDSDEVLFLVSKMNPSQLESIYHAIKNCHEEDICNLLKNSNEFIFSSVKPKNSYFPLSTDKLWIMIIWLSLVNLFLRKRDLFINNTRQKYTREVQILFAHYL